jgi:predicted alpha/beta-fold hydrolase
LAWNYRGCSGEINKTTRFYHSGATDDLDLVIHYAIRKAQYKNIVLVGFSLGGNVTLKYLGEQGIKLHNAVQKAVTFSVPLDLYGSSLQIEKPVNYVYKTRFLKSLKNKIYAKAGLMPGKFDTGPLNKIRSIFAFDDQYTAPLHGYEGAKDYYARCSAIHFISDIRIPTLIVNAKNDSFLSKTCYPGKDQLDNKYIYFEAPIYGGHCGFKPRIASPDGSYWSERRAIEFTNDCKVT